MIYNFNFKCFIEFSEFYFRNKKIIKKIKYIFLIIFYTYAHYIFKNSLNLM